jgi:hypothetical protein
VVLVLENAAQVAAVFAGVGVGVETDLPPLVGVEQVGADDGAAAWGITTPWPRLGPGAVWPTATVRAMIVDQQQTFQTVAQTLGTTIAHVRLAAERIHRPARRWGRNAATPHPRTGVPSNAPSGC